MLLKTLVISVVAGIVVELLFQLLKFVDETEKSPPLPKYITYDRYISVQEFVAVGHRRWSKYLFFRLFPPTLVFSLMVGLERKYFQDPRILISLLVASTISVIPRDLIALKAKKYKASFAEKSVHLVNVLSVYIVCLVLAFLDTKLNFKYIAPSRAGVVDNLWSTLFVAVLFAFYNFVSRSSNYTTSIEQKNKTANYVISNYREIERRYGKIIDELAQEQNTSRALIYAILIYENMNRPSFIRFLERIVVRVTHKRLSVGIAQVKSRRPLSDIESIAKAAQKLKDTQPIVERIFSTQPLDYSDLRPYLREYNDNPEYYKSIVEVLFNLTQYAPLLFRVA